MRVDQFNYLFKIKSLFTFFALTIFATSYWCNQTQAQTSTRLKVIFTPPAENKPQTTIKGATRNNGQCLEQTENVAVPFTPLLPITNQGLTIAAHPTLLFYLPKTSAQKVFFSWHDEDSESYYQTVISLNGKSGIISLTFPKKSPPLEIGKTYKWSLAIMCNNRLQSDNPMVQGKIKRVKLESILGQSLKDANSLESAVLYGKAGIWHETITTLAQSVVAQPEDKNLAQTWKELLTSVGLEEVAQVPLVKSTSSTESEN
ncbi:protein of unknown function DUF928 [Stanieria cyanosphaera PCC 7437]|uniref:DUF928 domain-containing protein n=1 Tax=Stanieria cyanosphaera (strain ATCC 29371 / PCC 7437) TaxID=111780 RepID=K9XQM5_STAC7|nr:DUF928 domain-containing protein [Stanieria cyanosphaera]AFZ34823.1 protein of unknown function DUF928 [Stanieria cyanosphaera PCC 7437]